MEPGGDRFRPMRGMDISGPFRGSAAVAAGALSRGRLAGPRFRRLFPDVYAPAALPVDLALRSRAAYLLVEPYGVLAGYSAAELLGASCGPENAPAEVICPRSRRGCPGWSCTRDAAGGRRDRGPGRAPDDHAGPHGLRPGALAAPGRGRDRGRRAGAPVPVRPRRGPGAAQPAPRAHGGGRIERVLSLVDRRAESPMESRIRVALVLGGLSPEVQYRVLVGGLRVRLDLAFPEVLLGVEFDGGHHRTARAGAAGPVPRSALTGRGRLEGPPVRRRHRVPPPGA